MFLSQLKVKPAVSTMRWTPAWWHWWLSLNFCFLECGCLSSNDFPHNFIPFTTYEIGRYINWNSFLQCKHILILTSASSVYDSEGKGVGGSSPNALTSGSQMWLHSSTVHKALKSTIKRFGTSGSEDSPWCVHFEKAPKVILTQF